MIWGQRYIDRKPRPEIGTRRHSLPFAWAPVRLTDGRVLWLQHYSRLEMYEEWQEMMTGGGFVPITVRGWRTISREPL